MSHPATASATNVSTRQSAPSVPVVVAAFNSTPTLPELGGCSAGGRCRRRAAGYLTMQAMALDSAGIGLVTRQRRTPEPLGSAQMAAAHQGCRALGTTRLDIVAPGANDAALWCHGRAGFVVREVGLWFHRWFDGVGATVTTGTRNES